MKLTQRDNGIWLLDYRDALGKRKRKSLGTRDKHEAERRAQDFLSNKSGGLSDWTLNDALKHCYTQHWQHQKGWKSKASVVKLVSADMGHYKLAEIDYALLSEFVGLMRKRDLKPATINRRLASISKALNEAAKLGKIQAAPPIPLQPENNKKLRWLSPEEEERMLARCDILVERDAVLIRALLVFLIDTGARLGEALNMQPNVVSENSVLFLDTKSRVEKPKHRRVPLTARALAAARLIADQNRLGGMFNTDQLNSRFRRVLKVAGLTGVTFHTMRHTCASRLIQRGAKIHEVREWLGHSSVTVTERYAHLADSSLDHLTALLDGTDSFGVSTTGHTDKNVAQFPRRKTI
ncbi:tyrosine-type recombinase/integrase [Microbulbifer sp. 2201CG32-9]|uniref:tyrosine-type recombinase/integrase n=1 Tax=Microbulbifer sp. 2201CG32-9 TaxID=3232309 RepID=UPI00345B8968